MTRALSFIAGKTWVYMRPLHKEKPMINMTSLKKKIVRNLPTIAAVTVTAGIVTASVYAVIRQQKLNNEIADALNAGLASGKLSTFFDQETGYITIIETASL